MCAMMNQPMIQLEWGNIGPKKSVWGWLCSLEDGFIAPYDLSAPKQGLGGDGAHVQASPAKLALFHKDYSGAKLRRPQCCHATAQPATQNSDVRLYSHHRPDFPTYPESRMGFSINCLMR